jgi:ribosomal protein S14
MMADLNATIVANGGEEALARINGAMIEVGTDTRSERTRFATPGQKCGRGVVRKISAKQVRFLKMLLATRVISTEIRNRPWFTMDVENISLAGARTMIDVLLGCDEKTESVREASPKQVEWLIKMAHKVATGDVFATRQLALDGKFVGFKAASAALDVLFKAAIAEPVARQDTNVKAASVQTTPVKAPESNAKASTAPIRTSATYRAENASQGTATPTAVLPVTEGTAKPAVGDGMYVVGERIFKVQAAKATSNLYAKELIDGSFEYVTGAITVVRREGVRMTLDEAKAYGRKTGQCCDCGRELTNPVSIKAGIGPICAGKY